ncbi:hypothetical protein AtubIFM55763_011625 [Aspergillus tubingensis]|nr:hypothetical protein AtubIFM55763_011625 [Aspergillus tubingensis]
MDSIMGVTYQKTTAIVQFDTIRRGEDEGGVSGPSESLHLRGPAAKSTTAIRMRQSNNLKQYSRSRNIDAMLRLDKTATLMEQRTSYHDTQKRHTTIFLRKLEY